MKKANTIMTSRRRLTEDEIEEIVRLRELGHSYEWIGKKLGCSRETVSWHCCRLGVEPPKSAWRSWDGIKGPAVTKRGNHLVRRFTPEEDQIALEMRSSGATISEIARKLNRRVNSVIGRLNALARREARREQAA
ncbi:Sigma-70, region 4 [Aquisphaera giovannonii]|uniref:Sigma-70, region 4 n=1 Tax=Aquisphaera giovannonii TaxID=406548 RepID=A0A5B9W901_9BACT|nr:helix-turn-helix domain-containing protein [Aquisphaera giovannonii]QEH36585.1 Sigma-70, region 4 [Aquisphaera giovannonii]